MHEQLSNIVRGSSHLLGQHTSHTAWGRSPGAGSRPQDARQSPHNDARRLRQVPEHATS